MKRSRTISVRVSEAEWVVWEAARATSGRKEMGAWVRAVVQDALGVYPRGGRPGDVPVVPEVNAEAYAVLVGAGNNLNQLTRYSHQDEVLAAGVAEAVAQVVDAARAVRGFTTSSSAPAAAPPAVGPAPAGRD